MIKITEEEKEQREQERNAYYKSAAANTEKEVYVIWSKLPTEENFKIMHTCSEHKKAINYIKKIRPDIHIKITSHKVTHTKPINELLPGRNKYDKL